MRSVQTRDTYDLVTADGSQARSGPVAFWMQAAFEKYLDGYKPADFLTIRLGDREFTWSNYVEWR